MCDSSDDHIWTFPIQEQLEHVFEVLKVITTDSMGNGHSHLYIAYWFVRCILQPWNWCFETGFGDQGVWPSHYETKQESLANEHTLDNPPFYSFESRVEKKLDSRTSKEWTGAGVGVTFEPETTL